MVIDRKERLAELREKHKLAFANPTPIKCLRVKGQIPLSEYPFINDRYAKIQKEVQVEEYKRYWGNSKPVEIPKLSYPKTKFTPTSRFAFISQFLP